MIRAIILIVIAFYVGLLSAPILADQVNLERLSPIDQPTYEQFKFKFNEMAYQLQKNFDLLSQKVNATVNSYAASSSTSVTGSGGVTVTSSIMRVQGSGGATTLTANPQLSTGVDGQEVRLEGQSDTNTLTVVDGSGLQLQSGQSFTLGLGDIICLTYNANRAIWIEQFRAEN